MNADPQVAEFFPRALEREEAERLAQWVRPMLERKGYGWWVLEIKDGDVFGGVIALQDIPFEARFTPAREVGWRLPVSAWGRGLATEGARAALAYAFAVLAWADIVAMTAAINVRSQRVMERLGMHRNAADDFPHPRLAEGHPLRPHVLYRLARGELEAPPDVSW